MKRTLCSFTPDHSSCKQMEADQQGKARLGKGRRGGLSNSVFDTTNEPSQRAARVTSKHMLTAYLEFWNVMSRFFSLFSFFLTDTETESLLLTESHFSWLYRQYILPYMRGIEPDGCLHTFTDTVHSSACVLPCMCALHGRFTVCVPVRVLYLCEEDNCLQIVSVGISCNVHVWHLTWRFASPPLSGPVRIQHRCQVPHPTTLTSHGPQLFSYLQFGLFERRFLKWCLVIWVLGENGKASEMNSHCAALKI